MSDRLEKKGELTEKEGCQGVWNSLSEAGVNLKIDSKFDILQKMG